MEEFKAPEIAYEAPEVIGKTPEKVGIDFFMLHFALWSNHYARRLQQAGIRYNPDSKTLKLPYGINTHLQIFNPCADFWDAITYVGLLSMYENMFVAGKVREVIGTVGSEDISIFGVSTTDANICKNLGYKTNNSKIVNEIRESIDKLSMIMALYRVKADPKFNNTELEGCRQTKTGRFIENRTIRFVYKYTRKEIRHSNGENILLLDGDFIRKCHIENYTIKFKKLYELRSKLNKKKSENEAVLGLYFYLLGNVALDREKGRFYPISRIQTYFQIVTPKLISELPVDKRLYEVQQEVYAEVVTKFRGDLRTALERLKELKLIQGWKACFPKDFKRDKRATSNYVNLAKAKGIKIWM